MAITIDGKEYDETKLDNNVKNSIMQVQNSNQQIAQLQAEILNHQILVQHHSKYIQDNLPKDEVETTTESITTNSAADAVAAAEAEIK
jgi:K+/H+ antiporter YhaU regulatory subunit KhtT